MFLLLEKGVKVKTVNEFLAVRFKSFVSSKTKVTKKNMKNKS